jgi:hypothetical protein
MALEAASLAEETVLDGLHEVGGASADFQVLTFRRLAQGRQSGLAKNVESPSGLLAFLERFAPQLGDQDGKRPGLGVGRCDPDRQSEEKNEWR